MSFNREKYKDYLLPDDVHAELRKRVAAICAGEYDDSVLDCVEEVECTPEFREQFWRAGKFSRDELEYLYDCVLQNTLVSDGDIDAS